MLFGYLEEKSHFGDEEIAEVIEDLRHEVAHQESTPSLMSARTGILPPPGLSEETIRLSQRVEQMERSVNRILPIVRKILFMVSEKQAGNEEIDQQPPIERAG